MHASLRKRLARSNRRRLKVLGCRGKSYKSCKKTAKCRWTSSKRGSHCRRDKNRRRRTHRA